MHALRWERRPNSLRSPALICAFSGWNDAAESASAALKYLGAQLKADRIATIDADEFVDFQSARPIIKLSPEGERELSWPDYELYEARVPGSSRDVILLSGPEPALHWRAFSEQLIELSDILGVEVIVLLGSLLADIAHTRPVGLTGLASDHDLIERLGLDMPSYEGPTGIVGVLYSAFSDAGFPTASVWVAVPHYVAVSPNPKGALALTRKVESLIEVSVDATELEIASADYERQVSQAVELDPDIQSFVEQLEQVTDAQGGVEDSIAIPSGEVIAREFQRFLQQRADE